MRFEFLFINLCLSCKTPEIIGDPCRCYLHHVTLNEGHCFLQKKLIRSRATFKEITLAVGGDLVHAIDHLFLILA